MADIGGFEPPIHALGGHCLIRWAICPIKLQSKQVFQVLAIISLLSKLVGFFMNASYKETNKNIILEQFLNFYFN